MTGITPLTSDLSRLHRETQAALQTAQNLSAEELRLDSLCAGWDRAHVIAHVASNARALVRLIDWAVTGAPQQPYSSPEARAREIEELAALPREQLIGTFEANSRFFAEQCERLGGELVTRDLSLHGKPTPALSIPAVRISEVVLHHHDLDTAWTLARAEPESVLDALDAAVRTMRSKGAPGMTLRTTDQDEWVVGDGAQRVTGDRVGLLLWLSRGITHGVTPEGELPDLPTW